jgi:AcrR family transcriptional regulator
VDEQQRAEDTIPSRPATEANASGASRHRDAANTRRLLLKAARQRFAFQGYAATTVRDVADDAGVNVALINRYFGSKEGLFEACLERAAQEVGRSVDSADGLRSIAEGISRQTLGNLREDDRGEVLLMLLRSSGDPAAEQRRLDALRAYGPKLAAAAGWTLDQADAGNVLLRAQLVLSVGVGIVVLRSSPGLEPLGSATREQLIGPLLDLVTAVLRPREPPV